MGRHHKPESEKVTAARIEFTATKAQRERYVKAAQREGIPLAEWIRKKLDRSAK